MSEKRIWRGEGKSEDREGVGVECLGRGKFVTGMMSLVECSGSSNRREVKRRCEMKPRSGPEALKRSSVNVNKRHGLNISLPKLPKGLQQGRNTLHFQKIASN